MKAKLLLLVCLFLSSVAARAQGSAFTYQGRLNSGSNPANGNYDFRFRLASDPFANNYVGSSVLTNGVPVVGGLFVVTLDFGPGIFTGSNYWLEVDVRTNNGGSYTVLNPLQPLTPTPYAQFAATASNLSGALPATQLSGVVPSANLSGTYGGAVTFNNASGSFSGNGAGLTNVNALVLGGLGANQFWKTAGNSNTVAGTNLLGTLDNQPLELWVNGTRALRIEPAVNANSAPNLIGGAAVNFVSPGIDVGTIGGGKFNGIKSYFGTIGGGGYNSIGTNSASCTIGGGYNNTIADNSFDNAIGGGSYNFVGANASYAKIGGGHFNSIGNYATSSTIGGGYNNTANSSATFATISGGENNSVFGFAGTIAGGYNNAAAGYGATIPGGDQNSANAANSFAAGHRAKALHSGSFVWGDSTDQDVSSTGTNQFLIRASGGVGIGASSPDRPLGIAGTGASGEWLSLMDASGVTRWHLNNNYGNGLNFAQTGVADARLFLSTNGNVGIGTNSPQAPLHILTSGEGIRIQGQSSGVANGAYLSFANGDGTPLGYVGDGSSGDNNLYVTSYHDGVILYTPVGAALIANSSGRVGIGRDSAMNPLEVEGNASKTVAGTWLMNSDARIKKDVRTVTNALDKLDQVCLVEFRYTDEYRAAHPSLEDHSYLNVIAQEFQKVFPDYVKHSGEKLANGDDILQVDTYPLTIYSASAIQELNRKVDSENAALRAENAQLKRRLDALEQIIRH